MIDQKPINEGAEKLKYNFLHYLIKVKPIIKLYTKRNYIITHVFFFSKSTNLFCFEITLQKLLIKISIFLFHQNLQKKYIVS